MAASNLRTRNIMQVKSILTESSPAKYNPTTPHGQPEPSRQSLGADAGPLAKPSFTPVNLRIPGPHEILVRQPPAQASAIQPVQTARPRPTQPAIQAPPAQPNQKGPAFLATLPAADRQYLSTYAHDRYYQEKVEHEVAQKASEVPPTPFRQIEWDDLEDLEPDMSPQLVRDKLSALFEVEKYGKGAFCKEAGTTNKSLNTFLGMGGSNGRQTSAYEAGWKFFKLRSMRERGVKADVVATEKVAGKKRKSIDGEADAPAPKTAKTGGTKGAVQPHPDISSTTLPGEETDSVQVYDTCDDIRQKITPYLALPGVTIASFLRSVAAQYHTKPKSIQSKQLNDFRGKRGPEAGNTSAVFYGAYVFFEKIRIAEGKEKSKKRLENEREYGPSGGVDTKHAERGGKYHF